MSKIGELLLRKGLITEAQLRAARALEKSQSIPLDEALVESKFIDEGKLVETLADFYRLPIENPLKKNIPQKLLKVLPLNLAEKWRAIPFSVSMQDNQRLVHVALADPTDESSYQELRELFGARFAPCLASSASIRKAIRKNYLGEQTASDDPGAAQGDLKDLKAMGRLVKAMRDLLLDKEVFTADELEVALKQSKKGKKRTTTTDD